MMEVVAREDDPNSWDDLAVKGIGGWWYQTRWWMDYLAARRPERDDRSMSFLVRQGTQAVAAVQVDEDGTTRSPERAVGREGEACWSPVLSPELSRGERLAALRFTWAHLEGMARDRGWVAGAWQVSPLSRDFGAYLPDFLASTTRAGFEDASLCSQVLDLRVGPDALRRGMSKGHRAAITAGRRQFWSQVTTDPAHQYVGAYVALHRRLAGDQGRPLATYEMMRSWMADGHGALVTAIHDDGPVGFVYLIVHQRRALYMSTAVEEAFDRLPVGHVLQDESIRWLGQQGVELYEVGLQLFGNLPYDGSDLKEHNIGRYKRGFGGHLAPLVRRQAPWPVSGSRPG